MTDLTDIEVYLLHPYVAIGMSCERHGYKKNGGDHDGNGGTHPHPVIEKAGKSRIYTHLHFFLQLFYKERLRGFVRLAGEAKKLF
jgi:hypothetical protein